MIEQIRRKDRLLFFPFDSIDPFLRLLEEAADRPDVASIKITIYRLAKKARLVEYLCAAAENGKEVTVLMKNKVDEKTLKKTVNTIGAYTVMKYREV